MERKQRTPTVGLALIAFLGGIFLLIAVIDSPDIDLLVHSDFGGSVKHGGDVLLRGEPIRSGESFQTIQAPLTLVTSDRSIAMRFTPGSDVTVNRVYPSSARINLTIRSGTGIIRVKQGHLTGTIGDRGVRLTDGILRWKQRKDRFNVSRDTSAGQNDTPGVTPSLSLTVDQVPKTKQRWHAGSLMPGRTVKRAVQRYENRHGEPPERLRDVFGYWVRDRRGNLFLYEHDQTGFTVTSAGYDQSLLTGDDQHWHGGF